MFCVTFTVTGKVHPLSLEGLYYDSYCSGTIVLLLKGCCKPWTQPGNILWRRQGTSTLLSCPQSLPFSLRFGEFSLQIMTLGV